MPSEERRLLVENGTCWRVVRADRFSAIIDAADFFRVAKQAMLKAQRSVLLIGWDFDARIEMEPEGATLEGPNRVGRFLNWIAKRRPELQVRILKWDIGMLNSIGRGETPLFMLNWMTHGSVELRLDGAHPMGAAHHMKLLVIDDALAFCGGIDMTMGRWDTREHQEGRRGRHTPGGRQLGPWHDATSCVSGPIVEALGEMARERWRRATDEEIPRCTVTSDPWPEDLPVGLRDVDVGIARTIPAFGDREQVVEIETATLAIIARARRTLYIESQYFASHRIAGAIAARLAEPDGPEILVINPDTADGWLEAKVMDSARIRMMHLVRRADRHDRFRILYPVNEAGSAIYVHAKIMIADDHLLKLGSANLNNRSMGFDTECDLILEAGPGDTALREAIAAHRNDLLAEHLGCTPDAVAEALARHEGSLIAAMEALNGEGRGLRPVPLRELTAEEETLSELDIADPERPVNWKDKMRRLLGRR